MKKSISGQILGTSVYVDDGATLVAENVSVTLPEITFEQSQIEALGTMSLPVLSRLAGDLDVVVNFIGQDSGFVQCVKAGQRSFEVRWAQEIIEPDGQSAPHGYRVYFDGVFNALPAFGTELGDAATSPLTFHCIRYKVVLDGETILNVDRVAGVLEISGEDVTKDLKNLL